MGPGCFHSFDDQFAGRLGQRGEDASRVEPAHAARENLRPIEVSRLEQRAGLVGPVIEDHRGPDSLAAIAVNGRNIRAAHAVVLEALVERHNAGLAHARLHQFSYAVVDHGRRDTGSKPEAIRKVGGNVVLAAGNMDID